MALTESQIKKINEIERGTIERLRTIQNERTICPCDLDMHETSKYFYNGEQFNVPTGKKCFLINNTRLFVASNYKPMYRMGLKEAYDERLVVPFIFMYNIMKPSGNPYITETDTWKEAIDWLNIEVVRDYHYIYIMIDMSANILLAEGNPNLTLSTIRINTEITYLTSFNTFTPAENYSLSNITSHNIIFFGENGQLLYDPTGAIFGFKFSSPFLEIKMVKLFENNMALQLDETTYSITKDNCYGSASGIYFNLNKEKVFKENIILITTYDNTTSTRTGWMCPGSDIFTENNANGFKFIPSANITDIKELNRSIYTLAFIYKKNNKSVDNIFNLASDYVKTLSVNDINGTTPLNPVITTSLDLQSSYDNFTKYDEIKQDEYDRIMAYNSKLMDDNWYNPEEGGGGTGGGSGSGGGGTGGGSGSGSGTTGGTGTIPKDPITPSQGPLDNTFTGDEIKDKLNADGEGITLPLPEWEEKDENGNIFKGICYPLIFKNFLLFSESGKFLYNDNNTFSYPLKSSEILDTDIFEFVYIPGALNKAIATNQTIENGIASTTKFNELPITEWRVFQERNLPPIVKNYKENIANMNSSVYNDKTFFANNTGVPWLKEYNIIDGKFVFRDPPSFLSGTLVPKRRYIHKTYYLANNEYNAYSIPITNEFKYCTDPSHFMIFLGGKRYRLNDGVGLLYLYPNMDEIYLENIIYSRVDLSQFSKIDIIYLPVEFTDDVTNEYYINGGQTISEVIKIPEADRGKYNFNQMKYYFFINGNKVPNKMVNIALSYIIKINANIKSKYNFVASRFHYTEEPAESESGVWEQYLVSLSDAELLQVLKNDYVLTNTEEELFAHQNLVSPNLFDKIFSENFIRYYNGEPIVHNNNFITGFTRAITDDYNDTETVNNLDGNTLRF